MYFDEVSWSYGVCCAREFERQAMSMDDITRQPKTIEQAFNVGLGNVLATKHPRWRGCVGVEQTGVFREGAGLTPDIVILHPEGLPVVVETEYVPAPTVEADACSRLGKTLRADGRGVEQSIALCIPDRLKTESQHRLAQSILASRFAFCVFSGASGAPVRWPEFGWIEGGINELAACIELASMSENRIARGLQILEDGIADAATTLRRNCSQTPESLQKIASSLYQQDGEQTTRMAMAIIANAMIFQTAIAGTGTPDKSFVIKTLDELRGETGALPKQRVLEHWREILARINYLPIFQIASKLLTPIPNGTAQKILERLAKIASELALLGATSQHDLSGRMFQRLIADRKFLATFYTLPSSAALLAELAVARLETDWADRDAITALRIADFACGTGALLNAAYQAVLSRHRRHSGDDAQLHAKMMESALFGSDIMPAATHLTTSMLSSVHPTIPFPDTAILTLPYGQQLEESGHPFALGALDLIENQSTYSLFTIGQERLSGSQSTAGKQLDTRQTDSRFIDAYKIDVPHNSFDLVIMNPPFTRPTNHAVADALIPSFAGFATSEDEQRAMSDKLARIRRPGMAGYGNAGLASNFIDIAHIKLKKGGVLALVLPATFLQGESWAPARALLDAHYQDIVVFSIAAIGAKDCAFSADTGMAEILIIATRKDKDKSKDKENQESEQTAAFVNLNHRPKTILEAVILARAVRDLPADRFSIPIRIGSAESAGCLIRGTLSDAGYARIWEAGIAQAASGLSQGKLWLPRETEPIAIPMVALGALGHRGLFHRDINGPAASRSGMPRGPFNIAPIPHGSIPTYPVLWAHDAKRETLMIVKPDRQGLARPNCDARAVEAWRNTASCLHFNLDFRINSQPLAACLTPEKSIGGTAWPNFICADSSWEIPLVLWANTILGLIAFWWAGTRQQPGRARLTITKLPSLAVIDPRRLSPVQLAQAGAIFEDFRDRPFLPANEAWRDATRQALDRAMLIDLLGLSEALLEPLALLRRQWCAEPSVHGGKRTHPT